MIEQIDDQKIILGLTRVISDFLSLHLPKNEPDRFLEPYVPYNLKGKINPLRPDEGLIDFDELYGQQKVCLACHK